MGLTCFEHHLEIVEEVGLTVERPRNDDLVVVSGVLEHATVRESWQVIVDERDLDPPANRETFRTPSARSRSASSPASVETVRGPVSHSREGRYRRRRSEKSE
ncbi:hypothetical protein D8S78_05070 [Natrialba swarupiae]|nr:hypothetical protein [Natrialba swarupiae]